MRKLVFIASFAAVASTLAVASETFGGIGVTIYAVRDGVRVVDVIPGSPAAKAGLEADDYIIAVDGSSIAGNDIEASKDVLRGTVDKPVELSVLREKDTLSVTLRRARIAVNDMDSSSVENWYGDRSEYSSAEIAEVARKTLSKNYELLSVMQDGRVIPDSVTVRAKSLSSVSVETAEDESPTIKSKTSRAAATLESFSRTKVGFRLLKEGTATVRIVSANGEMVARMVKENSLAGSQSVEWNGSRASVGRYMVHIEQNGAASAFPVELR